MSNCPVCGGSGNLDDGNYGYMAYHNNWHKCGFCGGKGWISITQYMQYVRDHKRVKEVKNHGSEN